MVNTVYTAWFDGSTNVGMQRSGIGWIIKQGNRTLITCSKEILFNKSITKIEYLALIDLLEFLDKYKYTNITDITIYGDNKTVIKQVTEIFMVGSNVSYWTKARGLLGRLGDATIYWVSGKYNLADSLSKEYYYLIDNKGV